MTKKDTHPSISNVYARSEGGRERRDGEEAAAAELPAARAGRKDLNQFGRVLTGSGFWTISELDKIISKTINK